MPRALHAACDDLLLCGDKSNARFSQAEKNEVSALLLQSSGGTRCHGGTVFLYERDQGHWLGESFYGLSNVRPLQAGITQTGLPIPYARATASNCRRFRIVARHQNAGFANPSLIRGKNRRFQAEVMISID